MAHQDILGILFIVLALRSSSRGRPILAGGFLLLAIGVKPYAGAILPFLLRDTSVLFEKFEQESPALDLPGVVAAPRRSYQSDLRRGA